MEKNTFEYYVERYIDGTITAEEWTVLRQMVQTAENEAYLNTLMEEQMADAASQVDAFPSVTSRILSSVEEKILAVPVVAIQAPRSRLQLLRRWWVAASIILVLGIGSYIWISHKKDTDHTTIVQQTQNVTPGKEGAILTLADGQQVVLDSLGNGLIAQQSGSQAIIKDGELVYDVIGKAAKELVYNTMTTPKGRQFNLQLPDGTRVWLNAASSIRYPTAFASKERRVSVTGEVYFEVAQNAQLPFQVDVRDGTSIAVLGTRFNVNAYENEDCINATLLEGSIRVAAANLSGSTEQVILLPGQQAQINSAATSTGIKVTTDVDIEKAMAWKNGLFNFNDLTFEEIMRQLERWYDIQVVYENNKAPNKRLNGKMTRDVPLQGLLKNLEKLGVRYTLKDRVLTISR